MLPHNNKIMKHTVLHYTLYYAKLENGRCMHALDPLYRNLDILRYIIHLGLIILLSTWSLHLRSILSSTVIYTPCNNLDVLKLAVNGGTTKDNTKQRE